MMRCARDDDYDNDEYDVDDLYIDIYDTLVSHERVCIIAHRVDASTGPLIFPCHCVTLGVHVT